MTKRVDTLTALLPLTAALTIVGGLALSLKHTFAEADKRFDSAQAPLKESRPVKVDAGAYLQTVVYTLRAGTKETLFEEPLSIEESDALLLYRDLT